GAVCASVTLSVAQEEKRADPVPLQRVLIPASRLSTDLERAKPGVLVPMLRDEFEAKVQHAAQALESAKSPPRLARSSYTAELEGQALVGGGQWSVLHGESAPGILSLTQLNLALGKFKAAGGGDIVLGDIDRKSPGLLIEKKGEHVFFFDWSLRGSVV